MQRGLATIIQRRFTTGASAGRLFPMSRRQEAMARRRDISIAQMNELYAEVNSSFFGYKRNRSRVIESKFLAGITDESTGEDVAI